jgi:hypothetical protein
VNFSQLGTYTVFDDEQVTTQHTRKTKVTQLTLWDVILSATSSTNTKASSMLEGEVWLTSLLGQSSVRPPIKPMLRLVYLRLSEQSDRVSLNWVPFMEGLIVHRTYRRKLMHSCAQFSALTALELANDPFTGPAAFQCMEYHWTTNARLFFFRFQNVSRAG